MRKTTITLNDIKQKILQLKGQSVNIQTNRGRKKIENYTGVIENIYPSVFTVKVEDDLTRDNLTCSYSDVLCGDVKIVTKGN